ncbi:SRPBCC family protein [soil metagenome]
MSRLEARIVSQRIEVPADVVYEFARQEKHLPHWASGLAAGLTQRDGHWFGQSPMGEVKIEMAPLNKFGVLDHDVTLPNGVVVHNAFRVTPVGDASLAAFVVLRFPDTTAIAFEKDVDHVAKDLMALKELLESS